MNHIIALLIFWSLASASFAETNSSENVTEVEIHSTAEISNNRPYRYDQANPGQNSPDEMRSNEGMMEPPISIETISPTKSRVVTRTTPRPSNMNNQQGGVEIGPVYVPIGTGNYGQPPGSTVILNPPQPRH